jgi:hypothetical protein
MATLITYAMPLRYLYLTIQLTSFYVLKSWSMFSASACCKRNGEVAETRRQVNPYGAPWGEWAPSRTASFYGGYTPYFYKNALHECGFSKIEIEANGGSFAHFAQWCVWFGKFSFGQIWHHRTIVARLAFLICLICSAVPLALLYLISRFLDRYDIEQHFTIGYHVVAQK